MACITGKMSNLISHGLIGNDVVGFSEDGANAFAYAYCGDASSSTVPTINSCTATNLDSAALVADFNAFC